MTRRAEGVSVASSDPSAAQCIETILSPAYGSVYTVCPVIKDSRWVRMSWIDPSYRTKTVSPSGAVKS
jgi:hypothetical protein